MTGAKRGEILSEWGRSHNSKLHAFYTSNNIISVIKFKQLRLPEHVIRTAVERRVYRVFVQRPEGKPLTTRSNGRGRFVETVIRGNLFKIRLGELLSGKILLNLSLPIS